MKTMKNTKKRLHVWGVATPQFGVLGSGSAMRRTECVVFPRVAQSYSLLPTPNFELQVSVANEQ